jgi:hypothetical protein
MFLTLPLVYCEIVVTHFRHVRQKCSKKFLRNFAYFRTGRFWQKAKCNFYFDFNP